MLRAQCVISYSNINTGSILATVCFSLFSSKQCITIIRLGFCDILNNQGLGKCYQPRPSARLITLTSTLIIPDITKTSSNNCLLSSSSSLLLLWQFYRSGCPVLVKNTEVGRLTVNNPCAVKPFLFKKYRNIINWLL